MMSDSLHGLLRYLDSLRERPPAQELAARLAESAVALADVRESVRFSAKSYTRNLIQAGPLYNLWVLCWRNGQRSPIHDHRASSCGVSILQGTLTETVFEFAPNGFIKPILSRDLHPGQVTASADQDVHQVSNLQADNADLVTLHIYSPPLEFMGTYSLDSTDRGLEPMLLEFSDAAGI